ncbi:MAG: hypothetical protein WKG07_34510 [Hymenobacter sp.]
MLAAFALFDNDPARINSLGSEFRKVTPAIMQANHPGLFAARPTALFSPSTHWQKAKLL